MLSTLTKGAAKRALAKLGANKSSSDDSDEDDDDIDKDDEAEMASPVKAGSKNDSD